jgi:phosphatidylglycerophosphate synthase
MKIAGSNRRHVSFLARPERAVLDWLVCRLPSFVTPDALTLLGLFGAFVTFAGYALCAVSDQFLWLASAGLILHWFGDSLDGSLARVRCIERPRYGFFLDQNIDVFGNLLIAGGMAASPFLRVESAVLALVGYQALTIYVLVRLSIDGIFQVSVLNSGPTEMRALLILMNVLILVVGAPVWTLFGVSFAWCDLTVGLFGLGFLVTFAYLIYADAGELRREDDQARLDDRIANDAGRGHDDAKAA